ncbi:MAG: flavin reductase family protein [Oscillospiraceae bacterium]|nr:flavin reductase family protein [Oscillospiraceae bacterium]
MSFKEISPYEIANNAFSLISKDWMLITAGDKQNHNTMTASWGSIGFLWNKPIATIYVRPQRYTFEFLEQNDTFTLSFFDEEYRDALKLCGAKSGREINKDKETGLVPLETDGATYYEQARLVLVCKKLYFQDITPDNFIDDTIDSNYANKDYHRAYIGQIVKVLAK